LTIGSQLGSHEITALLGKGGMGEGLPLYSMTTGADEKIGRDAVERYQTLRRELDERVAEWNQIQK
jgi:hypothetical protein